MTSIYTVGDLTLDAGRQELRRGAEAIHLGPLTYRLLAALVDAAPNVVSHDELADAVWDGRPVSPETISQRVKLLRDAIGDDAHHPRYVELLRGRGYRLIPTVQACSRPLVPQRKGRRRLVIGTLLALAAIALAGLVPILDTRAPSERPPRASLSIAVLPFADMSSGQDQEYLADGVAEEILNILAKTTPLQVIARTSSFSFKNRNSDIETIAEELNVSHILDGSVRRSENRIRIGVQLIAAASGTHVWAETYDREIGDILGLQTEIARSVAAELEVNLLSQGQAVPAAPGPVEPEAFDLYLRGLQQMRAYSAASYAEAEKYFRLAIEIDPAFMPAYGKLGSVYVTQIVDVQVPIAENLGKLRAVVERGLRIAPDDAGLIALSGQIARYEGKVELAEQRLGQAMQLDPANLPVMTLFATLKLDSGRPDEALQLAHKAVELDPLNPAVYMGFWSCHLDLWNAQEAIKAATHYHQLSAVSDGTGMGMRGIVKLFLLGDIAGSIRDIEEAESPRGPSQAYAHPTMYYALEDFGNGDASLAAMSQVVTEDPDVTAGLAYRHLVTGDVGRARELSREEFVTRDDLSASYFENIVARLAVDELIDAGDAALAVDLIERMAPPYADYRTQPHIPADKLTPAPYAVKASYSSYPALYLPDYIRALRAAGDEEGAENMLQHLETVLQWRRERGLFLEERHVAEARALRGDLAGALDALEQGERDRTIYHSWHLFLLHNEFFAEMREQPRFRTLTERVRDEMRRQKEELHATLARSGEVSPPQ